MADAGPIKLNDGHWIEALHSAHIAASMFEEHVLSHPVVAQSADLAARAEAALAALSAVYQAIGAAMPGRHDEQDFGPPVGKEVW